MTDRITTPLLSIAMASMLIGPVAPAAYAAPQQTHTQNAKKTKKKTTAASPAQKQSATARSRKKNTGKSSGKGTVAGKKSTGHQERSSDVKKREASVQKEIQLTQEQIKENDRSIKKNLNELGRIEADMSVTKKQIDATSAQVGSLDRKITGLQGKISENEATLGKMRAEYLKAVKKMRTARKNNSALAFIFASENFNQALRRMRYLRRFSQWKEKQSAEINARTAELKKQTDMLARTKNEKNVALRRQRDAQSKLQEQHKRQDAIVVELQANGNALKSHLQRKQAEVNQLRNKIMQLIAEEERRAAEEKARAAEQERLRIEQQRRETEERERREAEERERREAEERRLAEEQAARDKAAEQQKAKDDAHKKKAESKAEKQRREKEERERKEREKRERDRREKEKKQREKEKKDRERKQKEHREQKEQDRKKEESGRTESGSKSGSAKPAASHGNFAAMKGNLPRPVGGPFKVTRPFGRHPLPGLPDVMFDNIGIDAEVSPGATASAVFNGTVSKIYRLDGYGMVVFVTHGNYYTVYGNLASVNVKAGDTVKAGQPIGRVAPDEDDPSVSSIHFEIWNNREKLNPMDWIR